MPTVEATVVIWVENYLPPTCQQDFLQVNFVLRLWESCRNASVTLLARKNVMWDKDSVVFSVIIVVLGYS
ncbi:hypothetical protein Patl1_16887 [Pistacia atlantica]|uniref:Uncharacterized protein n=1 Tax=Pistacia atlantica TaxID=434234 RepID=A0ACC1B882_9ROSI|nr:hypothetical protein Patl1_16887 [Pistacia atlantica]